MQYYPDPIDTIMQMLRDKFGSSYRAYYEGDPIRIPLASLPAIVVEKIATEYTQGATRQDNVVSTIAIKVLLNKKDDYNAAADVELTERKLRQRCEGRDADTGAYLDSTVAGMFRKNMTLGDSVIDSDLEISYDVQVRTEEVTTSEALITLRVQEKVSVPDRM